MHSHGVVVAHHLLRWGTILKTVALLLYCATPAFSQDFLINSPFKTINK